MGGPRTAAQPRNRMNPLSIWALALSMIGITSPIGIYLGYRSRREVRQSREYGEPFARAAILVGWAYVLVAVIAVLAYLVLLKLG